jgi:predicted amino acid racemase
MAPLHLTIDLPKITDNARRTLSICRPLGIEVVGVTKAVCGTPEVARAMIAGGIKVLGDSRLENIARMQKAGIEVPMVLLRSPALSEAVECIARVNTSLNVDLDVLRALSTEASRTGKRHSVILMVDLDTGREGFQPEDLPGVCREVAGMKGLTLQGLGAYFTFNSEREFQATSLRRLIALAKKIEEECGLRLPIISGGSTNIFRNFILSNKTVKGVNQLRIGTAVLLGISSSIGPRRIQGFHHDTFVLEAELIELKKGDKLLGMLSLGQLDVAQEFLFPVSPGVTIVRASSDHTLVDVTQMDPKPRVGDTLTFQLGYYSLMRLMASPYVRLEFRHEKEP